MDGRQFLERALSGLENTPVFSFAQYVSARSSLIMLAEVQDPAGQEGLLERLKENLLKTIHAEGVAVAHQKLSSVIHNVISIFMTGLQAFCRVVCTIRTWWKL